MSNQIIQIKDGEDNALPISVEKGIDGIWTWKKYADGSSECYGLYDGRVTVTTVAGYHRGTLKNIPIPSGLFIERPTIIAMCNSSTYWVCAESSSTSVIQQLHVYDIVDGTANITVGIHLLGRWK